MTYPSPSKTVPALIREVALKHPGKVAIRGGTNTITFGALVCAAGSFASYLRTLRVGPGQTVAICMERSIDWIVGALGVMEAGAAYVPLDAHWPEARIHRALRDANAAALIGRESRFAELKRQLAVIDFTRDHPATMLDRSPESPSIDLESLAYIIYTSGSTGSPKGVEISHANLTDLVSWHRAAFQVTARDCASQLAGLGFDAAVWEIWPNLCAGATLCLGEDVLRGSPEAIQAWLRAKDVSIAFVPTVHAGPLMQLDWSTGTHLRILLTGGDRLLESPPSGLPFDVFNNYGLAECTVVSTYALLHSGDRGGPPPIGHPRPGAELYLLDEKGEPVPNGTCGEIYIGGRCVGRGYRNRSEETLDKFFPDPFRAEPGGRMFRTGDIGIRLENHQIGYQGRIDRRVKIRGQLVNLDEVGSVISQYPEVQFAAVLLERRDNKEQLIAFVQPRENEPGPTADELRRNLRKILPHYMIPQSFVRLRSLPVSANGKIDFKSLGRLTQGEELPCSRPTPPLSGLEAAVLRLIRNLLGQNTLEATEDFLLAGGDSLLSLQLIVQARDHFDVELTFDQIFKASTARELAKCIGRERKLRHSLDEPHGPSCLSAANATEPRAKIHTFWMSPRPPLARILEGSSHLVPLHLSSQEIDLIGAGIRLEQLAQLFVAKILSLCDGRPFVVGGYCIDGILAYEIALQLQAAGHEPSLVIIVDSPAPNACLGPDPFSAKLTESIYVLKRAKSLGVRGTARKIAERSVSSNGPRSGILKPVTVAGLTKAALAAYQPLIYSGRALLVLATDHAPHLDLTPGWRRLIPNGLHVEYVHAYHDTLLEMPQVEGLGRAISLHTGNVR